MKLLFSVLLAAATALGLGCAAHAQNVPEEIATPYAAYAQAMEQNDLVTARVFAQQAWEAGERLAYDPGTVAVLADNYAQIASAAGDHDAALRAYVRVAELQQEANVDAEAIAESWIFAANSALSGGETADARRYADRAGDMAERIEDVDQGRKAELMFTSRAIQAHALWLDGQVRSASLRAGEALEIAETNQLQGANYSGLMNFIAGAMHALKLEHADAAYRLTQAYAYMPGSREPLRYWVQHVRSYLDAAEQEALLERIAAANLPDYSQAAFELETAMLEPAIEGWEDARPQRRMPPEYPRDASRAGLEGVALIRFTVSEAGRVVDPEVVLSIPAREFGEVGLRAMQRWRYEPATINGEPVRRDDAFVQFEFILEDE